MPRMHAGMPSCVLRARSSQGPGCSMVVFPLTCATALFPLAQHLGLGAGSAAGVATSRRRSGGGVSLAAIAAGLHGLPALPVPLVSLLPLAGEVLGAGVALERGVLAVVLAEVSTATTWVRVQQCQADSIDVSRLSASHSISRAGVSSTRHIDTFKPVAAAGCPPTGKRRPYLRPHTAHTPSG